MAEIAVVARPFTTGSHGSARADASAEAREDARTAFRQTSQGSVEAGRKQRKRLVDGEQRRGGEVLSGDPLREGNLDRPVDTGCRVHLVNGSEAPSGKPVSDTPRAGQTRRWIKVTFPSTRRVATTSPESRTRVSTAKILVGRVPRQLPRIGSPAIHSARSGSGPRADCNTTSLRAHPIQPIHEPPIQTRDIGISRRRHQHSGLLASLRA